eukprot:scaffold527_cov368-Prasinococcus_capsulatus_cf.AAC.21
MSKPIPAASYRTGSARDKAASPGDPADPGSVAFFVLPTITACDACVGVRKLKQGRRCNTHTVNPVSALPSKIDTA